MSERHACGLIGMHRGSWRYRPRERDDAALRTRLRELAGERPRFGYRRLHIFLGRERTESGEPRWRVNHKRVYRLYREEGLAMRCRRRKRFRAAARVPLALPKSANEVWTMDYTQDELASGRKFRTLNLMDGYTREALSIEVDTSLPGLRVVRALEQLWARRRAPAAIQVDNGTEFTSRVVDQWAYQHQVALHFIERGKPTQNALIESFNGKFRDECLNQNWFVDLRDARDRIEASPRVPPRDRRLPPRRSFQSLQRGQVRMCKSPGVLTYDWTKNGGQVTWRTSRKVLGILIL